MAKRPGLRRTEEDEVIDLVEQWRNGNRKDVVERLLALPRKYSVMFGYRAACSSSMNYYDVATIVALFDGRESNLAHPTEENSDA